MTYLAPLLAGLIVGMIVSSFVLHWLSALWQIIAYRSSKPIAQVLREAVIVTIANSGFWILIVGAYLAHHVFSASYDKDLLLGLVGFLGAVALLSAIAYGFGRGGTGTLLMRFAEAMRQKTNFLRFGMATTFVVGAPVLWEWFELGVSGGFLLFVAVLWVGGFYLGLLYIWQFMPWDKPVPVREKPDGGGDIV